MKELLKKIIYKINYSFIMKDIILMESNPDLSDNTYSIFKKLIEYNINSKYRIIWFVQTDNSSFPKIKNVKYLNIRKHKIIKKYYNIIAKYIIDCNNYIKKLNKKQFRIHLTHGEFLKVAIDYASGVGKYDYILQCSDFFEKLVQKYYNAKKEQLLYFGYPRNDELLKISKEAISFRKSMNFQKIVAWIPTYRNHKLNKNDKTGTYYMNIKFPFGVPSIRNENELIYLNNLLKEYNIAIFIKLHPAEDVSELQKKDFSNIKIIDNIYLEKNNINLYNLLSICDALITDYSSIYYDFLLTKKPIGLDISDLEQYKSHIPLFTNNYEEDIAGEYIYNFNDLISFINNIYNDNDLAYKKRMEQLDIYHKYKDGNSAERLTNFFMDKIGFDKNEK